MDLTNFYENGLVLDNELHFGSGKDISDAINQMNDDGLAVSFIDTSGDVIRCMVKASSSTTGQIKATKNPVGMFITKMVIM